MLLADRDDDWLGQSGFAGQLVENRSLPVVSTVYWVDVAGQAYTDGAFVVPDPYGGGAVVDVAHLGRNPLRRHMRRAIGPIKPTSSKNAASGANPSTWVSCRCTL